MLRPFIEIECARPSRTRTIVLVTSWFAWLGAMALGTGTPPSVTRRASSRCEVAARDHEAVADYGARGRSNCAECHATAGVVCGSSRFGMTSTSRMTPATSVTSATLKMGHGLPGQ